MKELILNFFSDPATVAAIIGVLFGLFAKKGWTLMVKKAAAWASPKMREAGEALIAGSEFTDAVNKAIADDGSYVENSIDELKVTGKKFIKELKDNLGNTVVLTVEPKILASDKSVNEEPEFPESHA